VLTARLMLAPPHPEVTAKGVLRQPKAVAIDSVVHLRATTA